MKSKFTLPLSAQQLLKDLVDNEFQKERAELIIKDADVSDDVRGAFLDALSQDQPNTELSMKLADALKAEGMSAYIESAVKEAKDTLSQELETTKASLADANQNIQTLQEKVVTLTEDKSKTAEDAVDKKTLLIDQIADLSLALRKPEIDLEKVDDSVTALKADLVKVEDLKELSDTLTQLRSDLRSTFANTPSEPVSPEGQQVSHEDSDKDELDDSASDAPKPATKVVNMSTLITRIDETVKQSNKGV